MTYATALLASLAAACSSPAPLASGPATRVVSLHDVTTELVVALGATDRLVGVVEPVDVEAGIASAIARVPRVGDLESILAVRPAVVVGLAVVAAQDPELVTRLRDAGIAVYLGDPTTLDDVYALTRAVATRIGAGPAGDVLAARLAAEAATQAHARTAGDDGAARASRRDPVRSAPREPRTAPGHRLRVFVYDCCDPPFTAGGKTVLSDLIARAGGDNVFADLASAWTHVSWEAVVARRPELVVIDAYKYDGQGDVADKLRAVHAISALANLPTVAIPLGCSLGGLRSLEGLARLRAAIGAGA
jgi:iron complex transport system substrate-binding protein